MSKLETRICQNCANKFQIEPEDFAFYEKIKVPAPTFCPECRMVRRMVWRNDRNLYKRKDDKTGKLIFSMISQESPVKIMERDDWWSGSWDALDFGRNYNWETPFFVQLRQLQKVVPLPSKEVLNAVRSDYSGNALDVKDCYLVFGVVGVENSAYSDNTANSKECFDSSFLVDCEISYESFFNTKCFKSFFSSRCESSMEVYFSQDCVGCANCFGCVGLRKRSYDIFNKPYSKGEYEKKIAELNLGSYESVQKIKEEADEFWKKYPVKFIAGRHNNSVSGEYISNSKNVKNSYRINGGENLKYCQYLYNSPAKDSYDHFRYGKNSELIYESALSGGDIFNLKFCVLSFPGCREMTYCANCSNSSNLFGCIGLRNKQYCILNKQYTKEEYEELVPKIIKHMNEMPYISRKSEIRSTKSETNSNAQNSKSETREIIYRYGEFFPPELSPFAYNETTAQEYFPLTKQQALEQGYRWKDREERNYEIDITTAELPDHIKDVQDDILDKVIECANYKNPKSDLSVEALAKEEILNPKQIQNSKSQMFENLKIENSLEIENWKLKIDSNPEFSNCTTAFKIIPDELAFYRRMNLPLPRLCPNCRHYERLKQRNPLKLWHRKCQCAGLKSEARSTKSETFSYTNTITHFHGQEPCPNEFETSYAPDRSEIVYCEKCYLSEVV